MCVLISLAENPQPVLLILSVQKNQYIISLATGATVARLVHYSVTPLHLVSIGGSDKLDANLFIAGVVAIRFYHTVFLLVYVVHTQLSPW